MTLLLLAAALVGCAGEYPAEDFAVDHAEVTCQLLDDCMALSMWDYDSVGTCQAGLEGAAACGDAYDGDAALTCVEAVAAMSCAELYAGTAPASCESACPGLWGDSTGGSDTGR